jgi:hypothetical protein
VKNNNTDLHTESSKQFSVQLTICNDQ